MSIREDVPPLPTNIRLVDENGFPTLQMQQWWQSLRNNGSTAFGDIDTKLDNEMETSRLLGRSDAGTGAVEQLTLSQALDLIGSAAQGDILYRGASAWARLGAGTSGHFLKTQGTGANPAWSAVSASASVYEAGPPTPPLVADFTWQNQGTSTATDGTKALRLVVPADDGTHGMHKSAPATPYSLYARLQFHHASNSAVTTAVNSEAGIYVRDSSDGEIVILGCRWNRISGDEQNFYEIRIERVGVSTISSYVTMVPIKWLRITNDGTNLTFFLSTDGINWANPFSNSEPLSSYIDTANQIGFYARSNSNGGVLYVDISYFSTTAPS